MPVFYRGRVVGFTSCTSHLADLGGLGMGPEGSDIFDEGLLIPPCKLADEGEPNTLLLEIIKANSREPVSNEGDIFALMACCETGANRLVELMTSFNLEKLDTLANHIIETSREGALAEIRKLPHGCFDSDLRIDGYEHQLDLQARMTINHDGILLDFAGSPDCSKKGINVPLNYAAAYSVFAMRCIVGPDIPNNAGSLEPFVVTAPKGCIFNAQSPAPVAMRHTLGQLTTELVFGCLHQAIPDRVPAEGACCMYDLPMRHAPEVARDGGRKFAIELVHNGGTGARPDHDGLSATAFPSGVWGSQVEITEASAPVLIKRRELICDSGGAGTRRGGLGQRLEIASSNDASLLVFLSVDRLKNPSRGRSGGGAGACGRIHLEGGPDLPGKGEITLTKSDTLVFETPGGGGHGNPIEREPRIVAEDIRKGLVSTQAAASLYGYKT